MHRVLRWMVVVLLAAGVTAAVTRTPDDGADDLDGLRRHVRAQFEVLRDELDVAEAHHRITEERMAMARRMLAIAEIQLARSSENDEIQRRLLLVTRRTLAQTKELIRSTPELKAGS